MYTERHSLIWIVTLTILLFMSGTTALGQDAFSNSAELRKTFNLLEESQAQERRLLETLSQEIKKTKTPWLQIGTLLVSLIIAVGGWIFAAYQAIQARKEASRRQDRDLEESRLSRLEEHLFSSLEFFSGHTQRRSIGIAVVSANWEKFEHLRPTWVSLLVSQAIYLLTESKSHYKTHELQNLKDIITILQKPQAELCNEDKVDVRKAIQTNRKNKPHNEKNGLKIVETYNLDTWERSFN